MILPETCSFASDITPTPLNVFLRLELLAFFACLLWQTLYTSHPHNNPKRLDLQAYISVSLSCQSYVSWATFDFPGLDEMTQSLGMASEAATGNWRTWHRTVEELALCESEMGDRGEVPGRH